MLRHVVMWKFKDEAEGRSKAENREALETYINHPEHQKVGAYTSKVVASRVAVDFLV